MFLSQTKYFKSFKISLLFFTCCFSDLQSLSHLFLGMDHGDRKHTHTANTYAHWVKRKACVYMSKSVFMCVQAMMCSNFKRRPKINESSSNNWVQGALYSTQQLCWNPKLESELFFVAFVSSSAPTFFFFCYKKINLKTISLVH